MKKMVYSFLILCFSCVGLKKQEDKECVNIFFSRVLESNNSLYCEPQSYTLGEIYSNLFVDNVELKRDSLLITFYVSYYGHYYLQQSQNDSIDGLKDVQIFLCEKKEKCFVIKNSLGYTNDKGKINILVSNSQNKYYFLCYYNNKYTISGFKVTPVVRSVPK